MKIQNLLNQILKDFDQRVPLEKTLLVSTLLVQYFERKSEDFSNYIDFYKNCMKSNETKTILNCLKLTSYVDDKKTHIMEIITKIFKGIEEDDEEMFDCMITVPLDFQNFIIDNWTMFFEFFMKLFKKVCSEERNFTRILIKYSSQNLYEAFQNTFDKFLSFLDILKVVHNFQKFEFVMEVEFIHLELELIDTLRKIYYLKDLDIIYITTIKKIIKIGKKVDDEEVQTRAIEIYNANIFK